LLGLLDRDIEVRKKNYWKIDNVVVVQGGLYEGAFFLVPFLLEMLRVNATAKEEIYNLLFEIANGVSRPESQIRYSIQETPFVFYLPRPSAGIFEPLCCACRGAVLRGLPLFMRDLENGNLPEKRKALDLLTSFIEHKYLVRTFLKNLAEKETDSDFSQQLLATLSELGR
jgi:hypothetical protein